MSDTDTTTDEIERGSKPGVCEYCGYRIRPNTEQTKSVGTWDFAHQRCVDASTDSCGSEAE